MSLDYAILGFLNYRPFTGYDLKKALDTSVRHFWPADQTQIYRTLISLTEKGLAEMEVVDQANRPDRKVYRITNAGREALRLWLIEPHPPAASRNSLLIQVFFAGQLKDEEVLPIFERLAEQYRSLLAVYDAISQQNEDYQQYTGSQRELYFWMLTLEAGKVTARANLELVESILQRIRNKELPQG